MPKRIIENWMWMDACEMVDRAARLQRQFFRPTFVNARQPTWEPPIDVYETAKGFSILIALPGVAADQITVTLQGSELIVEGQRRLPVGAHIQIRRMEIPYGRFARSIELPIGQYEVEASNYSQGCLLISLLKMQGNSP